VDEEEELSFIFILLQSHYSSCLKILLQPSSHYRKTKAMVSLV